MNESYTINPANKPSVWIERKRWSVPDGFYYDTFSGEIFYLSKNTYVEYLGRMPNKQKQLELVGT